MQVDGPNAPCGKDCSERKTACHASCEKYKEYEVKRREYIESRYIKNAVKFQLTSFEMNRGARLHSGRHDSSYLKVLNCNKKSTEGPGAYDKRFQA